MTTIRNATIDDASAWLTLRHALWPEASRAQHGQEIDDFFSERSREPQAVLLAVADGGEVVGVAELSIRLQAEGCSSDRIGFLEGWYVTPGFRRQGVGAALVEAAEQWAIGQGCTEFASDTPVDNAVSAAAHRRCGFTEMAVIRCFKKNLSQ